MAVGTGAFSSVSAERNVTMDVVGDDEAFLGIEKVDQSHDAITLKFYNRFTYPIELTVSEITKSDDILDLDPTDVYIDTGESEELVLRCSASGNFTLKLDGKIEHSGDQIIDAERSYEIECIEGPSVKFRGNSGVALVRVPSSNKDEIGIVIHYIESDDGEIKHKEESVDPQPDENNVNIGNNGNSGNNGNNDELVGIEISGFDGVFLNPNSDSCGSKSNNSTETVFERTPRDNAFDSCDI